MADKLQRKNSTLIREKNVDYGEEGKINSEYFLLRDKFQRFLLFRLEQRILMNAKLN